MSRWRRLEADVKAYNLVGLPMTVEVLGRYCGIPTWEATLRVQQYKRAQRMYPGRTAYVVRKVPGTRSFNTRWQFGTTRADVRGIVRLPSSDYRWLVRQLESDLDAIAELNPSVAGKVQEAITALNTGVTILSALEL